MSSADKYELALPIGFVLKASERDYVVVDVLGKGGFGITYKVKSRLSVGNIAIDAYFAVKEFFPDFCWRGSDHATVQSPPTKTGEINEGLEDFLVEGQRLQRICKLNANIVNVNEVFRANGTVYYVMEYLSGGDLRKLIKENGGGFTEATMMSILTPVASALHSVHSNMMLHLDIKPDNIVMRSGGDDSPDVPVLIDFGIAVHFKKDGTPTTKHPSKGLTPGYSSAEQYDGIKRFDPRLDIYALSATCYYMLTGHDPKSAFEIKTEDVYKELEGRASERTINAIAHGLSKEASHRPATIAQFMKLFKESNALPVGAVVKGTYQNYMILGVVEETESFIHYTATTAREDAATTQGATTQSPATQGTKRTIYDLWEHLVPGVHKRQQSGVVTATSGQEVDAWTLPGKVAGYDHGDYGYHTSEQGAFETEYFYNGTEYLVVRQGYKTTPEWVKSSHSMWQKIKKPLLITTGVVALMAAAAWLTVTIIENNKQQHLKASKQLTKAINNNDRDKLIDFAKQDSVRAFLPLALLYEQQHDYQDAIEMAQKAVDSGKLSASDETMAQELIDRLTPLVAGQEPEQEELPSQEASNPIDSVMHFENEKDPVNKPSTKETPAKADDNKKADKKDDKKDRKEKVEQVLKQEEPKKVEKPKKSDDEIVQEAYNRGDMATVRAYAKKGNKKAKVLSQE